MRRPLVVVADASSVFRAGLRVVVEQDGTFSVCEAANLDDLLRVVACEAPELAVVDLDLPTLGGSAAVERLAAARRPVPSIVWSLRPAPEDVLAAVVAGAQGVLSKTIAPADLLAALRRVLVGDPALDPELAGLLIAAVQRARDEQRARESALSQRERHVLELIAAGLRNREIADRLEISEFTVKRHVQNILRKLGLPSRRAAAALYPGVGAGGPSTEAA
jgi:two-component system nitrate/nitrite response regulator NarL